MWDWQTPIYDILDGLNRMVKAGKTRYIGISIYPYTFVTDKQKEAMEKAGTRILRQGVYELTRGMIEELLKSI